jgi:hypothetical protein
VLLPGVVVHAGAVVRRVVADEGIELTGSVGGDNVRIVGRQAK